MKQSQKATAGQAKGSPPQRDRASLSPPKTANSSQRGGVGSQSKTSSPPRSSQVAPKAAVATSTSRSAASTKAPRPSSQAQRIPPKGKKSLVGAAKGSKPTTAGLSGSRSTRDLSQTMQTPNPKSPIKGILKKPRNLDESLIERQRLAASDDEQIRKINFQHHLDMAHKERKGFFPDEESKDSLENTIVNTNPATLGLSLINNTVNKINHNPLLGQVNGVNQRPEEVVLPPPNPPSRVYQLDKPINYSNLDWAFKEFMKVQEDMIQRGQIDSAIKNLEEGLNERLSLYPAQDDGVWKLTQLLADVNIKTAVRHLNNNQVDESLKYLKEARKVTEPLPNSDWTNKPEWVSLRKSVFKNMATFNQRKEDWNKALENFKVALKLDSSPINPDPLGAANTSLTCAVILSKLNKYAESIDYAQACMGAIEEMGNIDKSVPLSVYKQQIQKNGTKSNGGKMQEHDKMMTTYSICLHLLGKNLANLKYFKESKVFLQRAQYVASHLTTQPKEDLVRTIASDIQNLHKTFNKAIPDRNVFGGDRQPTIEETDSALQTIKTNLANASYSLAADFEEQKALLDQLIQKEDDKKGEKGRYDDKALEYVKQFIEEKKRKEKTAIDEYREKIAKDFDQKQTEFQQKQQKIKATNAKKAEKNKIPSVAGRFVKKDAASASGGEERASGGEGVSLTRQKLPPARGINSRSAGLPEQSIKAGDFDAEERKTRVKKSEKNLAAEGAKLDNLALRYSGEKGKKQFFSKRRVNIEKVNEKLGYFGGGILDPQEGEQVTLEGPSSPGGRTSEYNPFEDENLAGAANNATMNGSPKKGSKGEKSPVKLPPVRGYKLDSLGLDELGESVVKKSMDAGIGSDNPFKSGYKNPHTRRLLQSMDNQEYGKFTKSKSFKSDKQQKSPLAQQQEQVESTKPEAKPIREIPTYKPPQTDWRQEFRGGGDSDEDLLDTKKVIDKINKSNLKDQHGRSTLSRAGGDTSIFDDEGEKDDDPFFNDDINQREHDMIQKTATQKSFTLPPAVKPSQGEHPAKPPKAKAQEPQQPSSGRLPQINKRFQEDGAKSPERDTAKSSGAKVSPKPEANQKETTSQSPTPSKTSKPAPATKQQSPTSPNKTPDANKPITSGTLPKRASSTGSARVTGLKGVKGKDQPVEVEEEKKSYVPPNKRLLTKAQRLKAEEEEKAKKDKENSKKKKKDQDQEEGKQMKKQFDEDRLAKLATPKPTSKPGSKDEKRDKSPNSKGDEKVKDITDRVSRGKAMDFMSYLDRDVPAIDNKLKKKLEKAQSEAESGQQSGKQSGRNSVRRSTSQRQNNDGAQDSGADGMSPSRSPGKGLLAGMSLDRNAGLTLKGLRDIEARAAITIQRFMRGYFTKKWYMNYMMRKRLGVPFSGMEFASNVFIRQFNRPNQLLHQAALQAPQLVDIVQQAGASKNMVKKSYRHGKLGDTEGTDADKSPGPKRLKKGVTPQQLMNDLQKEFVVKGLDAYSQFKRMGVDALTDDNGIPLYNEEGRPRGLVGLAEDDVIEMDQLKKLSPRHVNVALDPFERMVPRWRGQNQERFLEVKEVADYLDRVTRVREYEEKQKDVLKSQQYMQQAKQMRRHELTTMASFAKAQGVFNRNPNKRNEQEDDEDYDPLDPTRKQDIPGGGPPGDGDDDGSGDGGSDQDRSPDDDGDPNKRKKKKKKEVGQMIRNLPFKEEDGSIPLKMYQQFSREQIVFYKRLGDIPMKWTLTAGLPFIKDRRPYLPVRVYGEIQNSRNMIMIYVMNLELMKISAEYYQYKTNNFETIWPMILYLFNHWVRYQVKLLEAAKDQPLFGPDEYMQPMDVAKQARLAELTHQVTKGMAAHGKLSIHDNDYTFLNPMAEIQPNKITGIGGEPLEELLDVRDGLLQARDEYDDKLNFSSEIEFDERFDLEKYKTLVRPEELVDRSAPADKRTPAIEKMVGNRRQLFNAYRMQIQEDKKLNNELDAVGLAAPAQNVESGMHRERLLYKMKDNAEDYDEFGRPNKRVRLKLDEIYEPIAVGSMNPFKKFLELHFVPLPGDTSGQYKLMKALAHKGYNERQNQNINLTQQSIAYMNEERRRRLGLLPLTVIDYNCIDRAALKLKIVLDCLYPRRQINGWALVPRDVKEAYINQEWQRRKDRHRLVASKLQQFSFELIKAFGQHIVYSKAYNERQVMIEQSINKIEEYKARKQLVSVYQQAKNDDEIRKDIKRPSVSIKRQGQPGQSALKEGGSPDHTRTRDSQAENAVMVSTMKSGQWIGDDSTPNEELLKRGLVQQSNHERLKAILGQDSPRTAQRKEQENEMGEDPNKNVEFRDEHEMPMDIPGFNNAGREPDVQDFVRDGDIFEQGIIRIKGNLYIAILVFRKIESNYENMKALIEDRIKVHAPKSLSHQVEMLKTYKGHLRMRSKLCDFVSTHKDVIRYDEETYRLIRPTEKLMLESEMSTKQKTKYKTFLEIKVCTKMSDTIWDDSFNLPWEKLHEYFLIMGHTWRLHDLLIKKRMSYKERFMFFNFFGMTLSIRDTVMHFDTQAFDLDTFKFNQIYLKQDELVAMRGRFGHMPYYFDDMIRNGFDECSFDRAISPYYNVDLAQAKIKEKLRQAQRDGIIFEAAELHPDRARLFRDVDEPEEQDDEIAEEGIHVTRNEERKKPELLVDQATKEYLLGNHDKTNMFNLTLTNFPQSDGLFLGRVSIGNPETYRTPFNLRLDYYSIGFMPTLQIKAYNAIYPDAFELKVYHRQTIKSFIRICNLSNSSMVINQLQSAITVGRKVIGRYIRLNFNKHHLYVTSGIGTQHGQDFINMAIANENLIRTMLRDNYRQFSGVMYFDNLGGRNLVTVSEFEIDMYQQMHGYQAMVHMNKHLSLEEKKNDKNMVTYGDEKPPGRRYQKVKLWKINLFSMADSKTYETVISYDDLHNYYESEFLFKAQAQFKKPDLIRLLSDYLRNLYIYRSKVGNVLYWRLPLYKRPLDPNTGLAIDVPAEQMYKLKMLFIYHALQKKIDSQNRHDNQGSATAPITMDQLKSKNKQKEPPALSLRAKLVFEKELPIYEESQALRVLKVTSSISEVLNQRPKIYKLSPTSKPVMTLVSVMLHPLMECWLWQIYIPATQRTFTSIFYPSDLFNINTDVYTKTNKKSKNASIWIEMVKRSELQVNPTGDIIIVVDKFKEPIKEILFQDHVYNENAKDIFFMEVVLKTHNNYVTNINQPFQFIDSSANKLADWQLQLRAFSLTRNVWIKDQMPLYEVIKILRQENYMMSNIKNLYYTMIRDASAMLAHKIIFSDEAKTSEVKKKALTYDIRDLQTDVETMERLKKQHMRDLRRKYTDVEGHTEAETKGLKTEWRNLIDLNKIFYQAVISQNPTQICTITYSDTKELFIYRLYRASDSSSYEKRILASDIARTCAPHYLQMLKNRMQKELGERISKYYQKDMLVASLMTYYRIQQEQEEDLQRQLKQLEEKYKPLI